MGTVGESAILRKTENLFEITCQFFRFHIESAKAFDAWCIDEPAPTLQVNHLREGRSMEARIVGIGNFRRTEINTWYKTIDEGGFSHPTITA